MHKVRQWAWWTVLLSAVGAMMVATVRAGEGMAEIVVAIRYLQPRGPSHSHLYLYRADGKLLRQLTKDDGGQDGDPVFAPDGETIVFTRELPKGDKQWWSVEPRGGNLHRLDAVPEWYTQTTTSPSLGHIFNGPPIVREPRPAPTDARRFTTPDGKTEGKIVPAPGVEDPEAPDKWDVLLRTVDNGKESKVGELPGYSAGFLSGSEGDAETILLREGAWEVAFCFTHLNSTDGNTVHALDLHAKRLVRLSPNWATPFPLPGEAAFLTQTEERYLPFGDGEHTANCSYLERWDAGWKKVRYARGKAAAVFYGASMYRPGRSPAAVTIRGESQP